MKPTSSLRIALIGGGPSALLVFARLLESARSDLSVTIFESGSSLGRGMPYSRAGAGREHITNVSGNEIPDFSTTLTEWVQSLPDDVLQLYGVDPERFNEEKILPRLLFGRFLEDRFAELRRQAGTSHALLRRRVVDIRDADTDELEVELDDGERLRFHRVVICTGHVWPQRHEGEVEGYYDSPYPPAKLARRFNHAVALRGSSLTALDAVRTLACHNGRFVEAEEGLRFEPAAESEQFRLVMHTRNGLLPCLRFRLDDPQVTGVDLFTPEEIEALRREHDGFVPLDAVYDRFFRQLLHERYPDTARELKSLHLEEFVAAAMTPREERDPFELFEAECEEARRSHAERRTVAWKEILAVLSYALNYPAKYFSAEDALRLQKTLMPLISVVIAFIPEGSAQQLLALQRAGRLQLLSVGSDSDVEIAPDGGIVYRVGDQRLPYGTFVDCIGQPHLPLEKFPFPSLLGSGAVTQARLAFRSADAARAHAANHPEQVEQEGERFWLRVPGAAINDDFQTVTRSGEPHPRLHLMAVPYMGGHNPDYSGLDFCDEASRRIVERMLGKAR